MTKFIYKSKCCNAEAGMTGIPDFLGSKAVCTVNFVCLKCNKPCDAVKPKSSGQKVCSVQKTATIELNVSDDIEVRLTEEGRKIYKEYRKRYRHDPIKKSEGPWMRVQLWEFMHIFGSRMFMGANAVIVGNIVRISKP